MMSQKTNEITRVVLAFGEGDFDVTDDYVGFHIGDTFYGDMDGEVFKYDITNLVKTAIDNEDYIVCLCLEESFLEVTEKDKQIYCDGIRNIHMQNEQVEYYWIEHNWILAGRNTICKKHNSVMTFGRYSRQSIFNEAHRYVKGKLYYCDGCVNEIIAKQGESQ